MQALILSHGSAVCVAHFAPSVAGLPVSMQRMKGHQAAVLFEPTTNCVHATTCNKSACSCFQDNRAANAYHVALHDQAMDR